MIKTKLIKVKSANFLTFEKYGIRIKNTVEILAKFYRLNEAKQAIIEAEKQDVIDENYEPESYEIVALPDRSRYNFRLSKENIYIADIFEAEIKKRGVNVNIIVNEVLSEHYKKT
jgi:hypothetical protein